jgi:hypothetical protein
MSTPPMFEQPEEEGAPRPSSGRSQRQEEQRFVDGMMYLLVGPLIGWPGWEDLMSRHKDDIMLQRLAHGSQILKEELCTEFEAMLYLSTASLAFPMSHDWAEIYMYLFRRWRPEQAEKLDRTQVEDLNRLRRWIFRTQMNHLKRRRAEYTPEAGKEAEEKPEQVIQPMMFNFESSEDDEEGE